MEALKAINPATGDKLAEIERTPPEQVPVLMDRSREAFAEWKQKTVAERLSWLRALRLAIVDELDECIDVISQDTGKPKVEAITADLLTTLDALKHIEEHAEHTLRTKKVKTTLLLLGKTSYVSYRPRGVVLAITPWNYPFFLSVVPVASALAGGNTVILKPSEVTPLVGRLMERMFAKAGLPEGVVQVAHGAGDVGAKLVEAGPDYIFFTGSVRTGKVIQQEAAKRLIPTTLELGGKDPFIVFRDANVKRAVNGALWGGFTNSGQMCMGTERIYVERPVYDEFVTMLKEKAESLRQADDDDTDLGSMTFDRQIDIVKDHVKDATKQGANLVTGLAPDDWPEGFRIKPMIVTDADRAMKLNREETFGPVVTVLPFDDEKEAIRLANDTSYGLSASVWSRDIEKAKRVADQLDAGSVCLNEIVSFVANPHLPFGGVKESGIGRYHGEIGMQTFCHEQSIFIDRGRKTSEVNWFPYSGKLPLFRTMIRDYFGKKKNWPRFLKAYLKLLQKSGGGK